MPPTASEIRRAFIDYFVDKAAHTEVRSAPVVPLDDPTLLFTNAGMNQFKDVFLGQGTRPYTRAVDSQKCIRAGGKHNDLEDVGRDTYHHTFFEMLGNWSFGDYFKKEAIAWGWDVFTNVLGVDGDRIYATYFEGNEQLGLEVDEEARAFWLELLPEERVLPFGMKDNFWEMGETGPCGPCSEMHYDRIGGRDASALVNADDPDVIELGNLVFIQFNRESPTRLVPLPAKHIDTGMGFERLVSVLQGKSSNYDTDLWTPIFEVIQETCDAKAYGGSFEDQHDIAYRVIADHARCLTSAIADGATPGAEGRGYVLRRILRRAVRHGRQTFGMEEPFLSGIMPAVADVLGAAYPEMHDRMDHIQSVISKEEIAFRQTLDRGLAHFAEAARRGNDRMIDGEDAFKLHDTFGFPIDLTQVMAEEQGLAVDTDGYERHMEEARARSRSGGSDEDSLKSIPPDILASLGSSGIDSTDDQAKFTGEPLECMVVALWDGNALMQETKGTDRVGVLLDHTPFYGEQGGQIGDTGTLRAENGGASFSVEETIRIGPYVLHIGCMDEGTLHTNDTIVACVDTERRARIRRNHTATHLLNLALRQIVGEGSDQRGSLVAPDRLRFDYAADRPLAPEELASIERMVCDRISDDLEVHDELVPLEAAQAIKTARAIFGEQYPDPVRVLSIGVPVADLLARPDDETFNDASVEFCGGTHLRKSGEADDFVVLSEQGLAAGIRRVLAVTGEEARAAREQARSIEERITQIEAMNEGDAADAAEDLIRSFESAPIGAADRSRLDTRMSSLREQQKKARKQARSASRNEMVERAREIASEEHGPCIVARLDGADKDGLLAAMDTIRGNSDEVAVLLLAADEDAGKVLIVSRVPDAIIAMGLKAGDWVKVAAQACGGGGGGRPDSAQAGGKDPARAGEALEAARSYAESLL